MKAESNSINDILTKNATSFFIPPFQRAYAWGRSEIERYFDDVSRIIKSELDVKQQDKLEHFFGTIVIKVEKDGLASKSIVVDGQQRLTTTLIFLIALRDLEKDSEIKELITKRYLTNESSSFEDKIKLKQVTRDWDSYRALINEKPPELGVIKNAYEKFIQLIKEYKKENPNVKFGDYIQALDRMNIAVITLDERPFKGEDPQIIFETLNSLGKPLTLSDLIRNFILLNLKSEEQSNIYEKIWYPKIEAVLNEDSSKFFRDYLQYKTSSSRKVVSDNNTKELYQQFKDFVEEKFQSNHNAFIEDITKLVCSYKWIITEVVNDTISTNPKNNKEIKELLRNIFHDIKTEAFKPFVLGLLEYHQYGVDEVKMKDEILIDSLLLIRIYLIKRRVLRLNQGENKDIPKLSKRIVEIAKGNITILEILSNLSYNLRLPNDDELKESLNDKNFYEGLKSYSKFILGKIEEYRSKVAVNFRNSKITIEHIMPKILSETWKVELGANYEQIHKDYLDNMGNLILTEFNSEMGNKSFEEKKEKLKTSSLNYRLRIIDEEIWNKQNIIKHRDYMIDSFLETFPLPASLRQNNNWDTKIVDTTLFSPLDDDAEEIADKNKPKEMVLGGKVIPVSNWVGLYIKFLRHIKNMEEDNLDILIENQNDIFGRDDIIIKWKFLKEREIKDKDSKYKTFNGNSPNNTKENLTDDLLFIHTNMNTKSCIRRIRNIINKLDLPRDFMLIHLA